jgi:alpha-1,2-mannosyltransferase
MISKRLQIKLALFFCAMIALQCDVLWQARESIAQGLPDFSGAYTAGLILRAGQGDRLYDDALQESLQRSFSPIAVQKRGTILPYIHLPYEALLYEPLAYFSYPTAYTIWLGLNLALLGAIPFLLRRQLRALGNLPPLLWLLACLGFYPIFVALIQGQDSVLLLFLYCLVWRGLERGSELASGSWLALGLYKYHLVAPFVLPFWRRKKFITGFLSVAVVLGLISLAITGWSSLLRYPSYLWGTEHDLKYGFNNLPGLIANLRGLISGIVPNSQPQIQTGVTALLSAVVLVTMLYAAGKTVATDFAIRQSLFALFLVGTSLVSYHLYVHDLSPLFLALVLLAEVLISRPAIPKWTRTTLWICLSILFFSPLYLILSLRYRQLRLLALVLVVLFIALISLKRSLSHSLSLDANRDEAAEPRASAGR